MAYRNIVIENPAHISVRNRQLIIRTDSERSLPMEDISALLLENQRSTITTAALSQLGQCGCAVYMCDEKHLPCAVTIPFCQHSRSLGVISKQLSMTQPTQKRLWQEIVVAKITNQAKCLSLCQREDVANQLLALSRAVRSGDSQNMEAVAAAKYFPALLGDGFSRGEENGYNSALNYGYAILRGAIARSLAVYGFLPSFGLHHHSELNPFNLADDCIEPFRPIVDLLVEAMMNAEDTLSSKHKRMLLNVLNLEVLSGGQRHSVSYAIERMVQSLRRATDGKTSLCLPELLQLKQHAYE